MPPLGAAAAIDVFPEFREGLYRLEKHSHVWVLAWLDRAERDVLKVTPRGALDRGPGGLHGVFAVRSPARPNPVGLTAARILGLREDGLDAEPIDFLDGTPVIDIKPYFVTRDAILSANNAPVGRPLGRDALRHSLRHQAENYHGELCPDLALAVRVVEHFRASHFDLMEPAVWRIHAPAGRCCLSDALAGMTRATPGRNSLTYWNRDAVALHDGGSWLVYVLRPSNPRETQAVLSAADDDLFEVSRAPGDDLPYS